MPRKLERKLRRKARKRGYGETRTDKYVHGTLANLRKKRKRRK